MTKTRKIYSLLFISSALFIVISLAGFKLPNDDLVTKLVARFQQYMQALPQEKIYLHLDKPYYVAGETIWYKAYVVNARTHQPDTLSKIAYVEFISPAGQILIKQVLKLKTGAAPADFNLPDSLAAGTYHVRAYTNWMRNLPEGFLFQRAIPIYNNLEATTGGPNKKNRGQRPEAETTKNQPELDVQFFPEGGNLIAGFYTHIGFKALNKAGKGEDISGVIVDEAGKEITTFKSTHLGMGRVLIMPEAGKSYQARIKTASGEQLIVPLPTVQPKGFSVQVNNLFKDKIQVAVYQNVASGDAGKEVILLGQIRGELVYVAQAKAKSVNLLFNVPKDKIPAGVVQFTLFDKATLTPLCERLAYVHKSDRLQINIKPNKENYKAREAITFDLTATNDAGQPVAADFSLAVTDAALYPEEPNQNLATYLLLTSDLRGHIEQPAFYFRNQEAETQPALDNLMLTQGWRRFTWKEVLADSLKMPPFYPEASIAITGQVNRLLTNKPLPNAEVVLMATGKQHFFAQAKTDDKGKFFVNGFDFDSTLSVVVTAKNQKGKANTAIVLDKALPPPLQFIRPAAPAEPSPFTAAYIARLKEQQKMEDAYLLGARGKLLKQVEIKAKKVEATDNRRIYGTADNVIKMDERMAGSYTNILEALQGKVAGVMVTGSGPNMQVIIRGPSSIQGSSEPLFLLDDMPIDMVGVSAIAPNTVETIEVLKGPSAAIYGSRGANGVIAIFTKRGQNAFASDPAGIINNNVQGYYKAREFYAPRYDVKKEEHNLPDRRSTLYWNPFVRTDAAGKASVTFYNADAVTNLHVIMAGISKAGVVGCQTAIIGK